MARCGALSRAAAGYRPQSYLIAIVLYIVFCAAAPAGIREIAVSGTDEGFIAGAYFQLTQFGWFNVSWTEPGRMILSTPAIAPDGDKPKPTVIGVRAEPQHRLQALLGLLDGPGPAARGTYVLDIQPPAARERRLVWSAADETAPLAQIRSVIDKAAHLAYRVAILALARGRDEARRGADEQACGTYLAGLDALGDRYAGPDLLDDTGMKLLLAHEHREQHRYKAAATIYERILEARVTVYAEREAPKR